MDFSKELEFKKGVLFFDEIVKFSKEYSLLAVIIDLFRNSIYYETVVDLYTDACGTSYPWFYMLTEAPDHIRIPILKYIFCVED